MTINQAHDSMLGANAALSKLNTFLMMMKITSGHLGENPDKAAMIEWMNVTDMLIDLMEELSPAMENVECVLRSLLSNSRGVQL